MGYIDFEAKTDRELLILVAQKCNESTDHLSRINDKLSKHEDRIRILEGSTGCTKSKWRSAKDNWQVLSLLAVLISLIVVELLPVL